jgi:TM2 domain-containing membrane protein YozV
MNWTENRLIEKDPDPPKPVERSLVLSMALGWCVPGLGHVYMKKYLRGSIFFASVVLLFIAGLSLSQWTYTTRADFPFYLTGKYGSGLVLFGQYTLSQQASIDLSVHFHYLEIGVLFISVAGLLNAISVLNLIDVKWGRSLLLDIHEENNDPDVPKSEDNPTT